MKYLFTVFTLLLATLTIQAQSVELLKFNKKDLQLGKINKGDKKSATFRFKNTNKFPVEIETVSTCECTEATYPMTPIKPGKEGTFKIIFDSSKKHDTDPLSIDIYYVNKNKKGKPIMQFVDYTFMWK